MGAVRAELERLGALVVSLQHERAEQQGRVETRLAEVAATSARLADTTQSLRRALATPAARGQWGERMADDVLRAAGLVEGVSYRKQSAHLGGHGPRLHLPAAGRPGPPHGREVPHRQLPPLPRGHDRPRARPLRLAFVRDVGAGARAVGPVYIDPDETLDEVLLFIPNEAVYAFVHTHDHDLVEVALGQKVVLCSPTTLFSVLAVIRQAVEQTQLQRTSDEILRCLASFETQWVQVHRRDGQGGPGLDTLRRGWDA